MLLGAEDSFDGFSESISPNSPRWQSKNHLSQCIRNCGGCEFVMNLHFLDSTAIGKLGNAPLKKDPWLLFEDDCVPLEKGTAPFSGPSCFHLLRNWLVVG